ncbi:DUF4232 domain-containing protein [Streptomyces corynorhini]|uniref:DUF4232 domain-containing protein n=1 Tax=Streptomyces corynorhini TaxID=2282652 RepID=A0A370BK46_9ACTN|nr:DUF4232 domain-containing protein [Streptomyces corynorhini]RDG39705.1 hypothetical protein DVH02_02055 [Streptomyces corynorhini]
MRSRLATRSARLVLAAAAVTALAATTTACDPDDIDAAPTASAASTGGSSTGGSTTGGSSTGGSGDTTDDNKKDGYGQSCGTNDLDFTATSESQAGGYYLVTAKAKSGITCYLDVNTPEVSFGSKPEGVASPVGQGGEDPIKLSGSTVAYTGVSPKSTNTDGGVEFEFLIISVTEEDADPAEVKLPDTATVDKPLVTNWSTTVAGAVPRIV